MKIVANLLAVLPTIISSAGAAVEVGSSLNRTDSWEGNSERRGLRKRRTPSYEVWGSDHSNSVPGQAGLGQRGSFLWIYDSRSIARQLRGMGDAVPLSCVPTRAAGPCDAVEVFPQDLAQVGRDGPTGMTLADLPHFGRLHGVRVDPQRRYVNANFFTPGGAYIGIIDVATKEAVSLFRLTKFGTAKGRSVHMSFWTADGSAVLCTNLHGKAIERLNVLRDEDGAITDVQFDRGATLGLGTNNTVLEEGTFFEGLNAFGNPLVGSLTGEYSAEGLQDLTPNGYCKEDGCPGSALPPTGRVNNVPICPIPSTNDNLYVNFGGGGILVVDPKASPVAILGEYDSETFNGAGCGGIQVDDQMFMTAGVSAGAAGAEQSTFGVYSFDDTGFFDGPNSMNEPPPNVVFKDPTNTNTLGNVDGVDEPNLTGQLPGTTSRRDAHGLIGSVEGGHIHQFDRIQNNVETFDVRTYRRRTYDLTSRNGRAGIPADPARAGPCYSKSVPDDPALVPNNPSPDLIFTSPDGRYIFAGLRGPAPVTVPHSAQGSCPGIGIVEVLGDGKRGRMVDVIRTTNTVDTAPLPPIVGGTQYAGVERSDVHSAIVVVRDSPSRSSKSSKKSPSSE